MKKKVETVHSSGKRKRAIARATLKKGKGIIRINRRRIETFPEIFQLRIRDPIVLAGPIVDSLNINVNIRGGGIASQAESARLAIAKVLVEYTKSEELRKKYLDYDRHLLVADTRYRETRKPGTHSKARSKRQKSYR